MTFQAFGNSALRAAAMLLMAAGAAHAQTATFINIGDALPARCYNPATTAADPTNPNRLLVGMHAGIVSGSFGTSAECLATDSGPSMTTDTIVFYAVAPPGYYVSRVTFSQTAATSGSRGGRGFASASWVVADDAMTAAVGGTSVADLTGRNLTVVPVKFTTFLAAAGGSVRSGSARASNASAVVELLPLTAPPPPPPPPPANPVPNVSAISPASAIARGPAFTLTVTGSGFIPGSVVRWNGVNVPTTPVSGTQLRASIGAAAIAVDGQAEVRVFNPASGHYSPPDGGLSSPFIFTITPAPAANPVPATTSITPATAIAGSAGFSLTVNGSGFFAGSVVRWNGVNRTTTFVSPTQLTAAIGEFDVIAAGTSTVTVFNPAAGFNPPPDGGTSNAQTFTTTGVLPPPPPVPGPAPVLVRGNVDDQRGREWRQLTPTRGLSRTQLAALCPADGPTPFLCAGKVGALDLTDWVWADAPGVFDLYSYFTTGVNPTTPHVDGQQYAPPAIQFQDLFTPTLIQGGCTTWGICDNDVTGVDGLTASTTGVAPVAGAVSVHGVFGFPEGSFTVGAVTDAASASRGAYLWRATGRTSGAAHAYADEGPSPSPFGGVAVNVLANDWVGGAVATTVNGALSVVTAPVPSTDRVTLLSNGAVQVAAGALAGTYTLNYRLCAVGSSTCDDAQVAVVVRSYPLVAGNDSASATFGAGGSPVNVLTNDFLNNQAATTAVVTLLQVSSSHPGITLNTATGAVVVASGTPSATHSLTYQVCEIANPVNCRTATVTLTGRTIDAVDDVFAKLSNTAGTSPSVLTNDRYNGAAATTALVQLSLVTTLPAGVTFDLTTGRFVVANAESGDYPITYRICEIGSPTNCDTASLVLELSGSGDGM